MESAPHEEDGRVILPRADKTQQLLGGSATRRMMEEDAYLDELEELEAQQEIDSIYNAEEVKE